MKNLTFVYIYREKLKFDPGSFDLQKQRCWGRQAVTTSKFGQNIFRRSNNNK